MFGKRKEKKDEDKGTELTAAKSIAEQYTKLSNCCELLSAVSGPENQYYREFWGWKVTAYTIERAGIDIEEVYAHIKRLATKKKAELELELAKLDQ